MLRRILRAANFNGVKSSHPETEPADWAESFSDFAELEQVGAKRAAAHHKQSREEKVPDRRGKRSAADSW